MSTIDATSTLWPGAGAGADAGEALDAAGLLDRHPGHAAELKALLDDERGLSPLLAPLRVPAPAPVDGGRGSLSPPRRPEPRPAPLPFPGLLCLTQHRGGFVRRLDIALGLLNDAARGIEIAA